VRITFLLVAAMLVVFAGQGPKPVPFINASDIAANVDKATPRGDGSKVVTFLDDPRQRANFVRRTAGIVNSAILHGKGTEVHYIVDGSATLITGGTLMDPGASGRPDDSVGTGIKGGQNRRVAKGDVIVIPPGTPHQYTDIAGTVTYLEVRFDTSGN
jgi:mannose-6-phosphate isomerase-like protein (cupin superfamily)